jgi:hypothetical protein
MPRPAPAVPVNVAFYARTTQGERDALAALLEKKTQRMRAVEPTAPAMDMVGWFRAILRREAEAEGIAIIEPGAPPLPPPAPKRKAKAKRAKGAA